MNENNTGLTAEKKYELLLKISARISGTLDLNEMLYHLLETAGSIVAYDAAGIFVLNRSGLPHASSPPGNLISGMATIGFESRHPDRDPMLRSGLGITGHVIKTGKAVVAPDVREDTRYVEGRPQTLSEIAIPIVIDNRVIGALNLESNRLGAYSEGDVSVLQFFADAAARSIEKAVLHKELLEIKRIERQLEIAREVQASLLPDQPPRLPGYEFAASNIPSSEIGGDYYDYIRYPNGHIGIAIADVAGKGVPAALIMATFRAALRTQVRYDEDITRVMKAINSLLVESIGSSSFVTAVYGVLDPASGRFIYSNCGHNPPMLLIPNRPMKILEQGGPMLGFIPEAEFDEGSVTLEPGDTLLLYTDGVIEINNPQGAEFGVARLEELLQSVQGESAEQSITTIQDRTRAFAQSQTYPDDFTLVVAKRLPVQ